MTSKSVTLNQTEYTLLDTTTDAAILSQNRGDTNIQIILSATKPALFALGSILLKVDQALQRNGATGDMWALSLDAGNSRVTVME